jgi:hypothetical protein
MYIKISNISTNTHTRICFSVYSRAGKRYTAVWLLLLFPAYTVKATYTIGPYPRRAGIAIPTLPVIRVFYTYLRVSPCPPCLRVFKPFGSIENPVRSLCLSVFYLRLFNILTTEAQRAQRFTEKIFLSMFHYLPLLVPPCPSVLLRVAPCPPCLRVF